MQLFVNAFLVRIINVHAMAHARQFIWPLIVAMTDIVNEMDDSIARICEEVDRDATVVFLVQLFGMHEIIESYENGSILVSQMFRDMVYDLESTKKISCYFVFQDLRFIVGFGDIVLEAEKVCRIYIGTYLIVL